MKKLTLLSGLLCFIGLLQAQPDRWQQRINYEMSIDLDVNTHQFTGAQTIRYTNNSPDTLRQVFFHLFFNAFQPNSSMDVRSLWLPDPDRRVMDRISKLKPNETGQLHVKSLKMNKKDVKFEEVETILEVALTEPILPNQTVTFETTFEGQVPVQIRRSGRDNAEGIAYSMAQWYPKMCEYDYMGWHANPYIAREFYGVWGDFDVKITLDSAYTVAAGGYLQNPEQIGHGYPFLGKKLMRPKGNKLTWHFKAPNVHDFVWAADPDYEHIVTKGPDGLDLHFFYQPDKDYEANWKALPEYTAKAFAYMNQHFGKYPYQSYSVIQGGDGGMEYPMATLITGKRSIGSLVGVTVHEMNHSWFQMILGSNESLHPWMDEGFTEYATYEVMKTLFTRDPRYAGLPHGDAYEAYFSLVESGKEEPLSTHADHYATNRAYGISSYSKGEVFLQQLGYVIGEENLKKGMLRYYDTWKFKHPNPNDFIRIMEKTSGLELDWYLQYFGQTTKTIDYGIKTVVGIGEQTQVVLERKGEMIMPVDVLVTYADGKQVFYHLPLDIMRGAKAPEIEGFAWEILPDWRWVETQYPLTIPASANNILSIEIDPSYRMADLDRQNNLLDMRSIMPKP